VAVLFLDTSALVKRYAVEVGSSWVTAQTEPASRNECWLAALTRVEVLAALALKVRTGHLTLSQARRAEQVFRRELATHFQSIDVTRALLHEAMRLVLPHALRAYDAVQLATALQLHAQQVVARLPAPIFVSADGDLNRAALAEGLQVDDPALHP
jgi:predicted nucleic acid-binding protein